MRLDQSFRISSPGVEPTLPWNSLVPRDESLHPFKDFSKIVPVNSGKFSFGFKTILMKTTRRKVFGWGNKIFGCCQSTNFGSSKGWNNQASFVETTEIWLEHYVENSCKLNSNQMFSCFKGKFFSILDPDLPNEENVWFRQQHVLIVIKAKKKKNQILVVSIIKLGWIR